MNALPPPVPIEPTLIAGYLVYLGPDETRLVVLEVANAAEVLLDRIEAAAAAQPAMTDDAAAREVRNLAHDIAGTFGSLGLAIHAAMARAIETAVDFRPAVLQARLEPLLAVRGRIGPAAVGVLDRLLAESEDVR